MKWAFVGEGIRDQCQDRVYGRSAHIVFGRSAHVFRGVQLYRGKPILFNCGDHIDDYTVDDLERNDESFIRSADLESRQLRRDERIDASGVAFGRVPSGSRAYDHRRGRVRGRF